MSTPVPCSGAFVENDLTQEGANNLNLKSEMLYHMDKSRIIFPIRPDYRCAVVRDRSAGSACCKQILRASSVLTPIRSDRSSSFYLCPSVPICGEPSSFPPF